MLTFVKIEWYSLRANQTRIPQRETNWTNFKRIYFQFIISILHFSRLRHGIDYILFLSRCSLIYQRVNVQKFVIRRSCDFYFYSLDETWWNRVESSGKWTKFESNDRKDETIFGKITSEKRSFKYVIFQARSKPPEVAQIRQLVPITRA